MGLTIWRGSTPTLTMRPGSGYSVSDMGTPKIVISQELVYLEPDVTVVSGSNAITCKLTEQQTLRLVAGAPTYVQQMWKDGSGNIVRFPVHTIIVERSLAEEFDPPVTPQPEPEPTVVPQTITEVDEPFVQVPTEAPDENPDVYPGTDNEEVTV